ncbi:MAG: type VI secretion system Vgr family protein, partial [Planctomycetes bacterium]|nr:type VI secretion system Vgr family protein [Planctomycetota bacterium]
TAATVRRLLEDEGVFTYHVHQADGGDGLGGHTLVLSEINRNHGGPAAGEDEQAQARRRRAANPLALDVVGGRGAAGAANRCLWRWQACERDGAAGVAVADRDYRDWSGNAAVGDQAGASALDLAALGSPAVPAGLVRHEFPAGPSALKDGSAFAPGAPDTSLAEWLAERRAGEQLCRRRRLHGEGDHTHLQAGTVMAFAARPDETFLVVGTRLSIRPLLTAAATGPASEALRPLHDALAALALSAAEVRWARPAFDLLACPPQTPGATLSWQGLGLEARCSVEALPLAIPFVPERRQPPPALAGVHLATVVAEDGTADAVNTLHTDALARVQVAFPWDRSHPTGWIRVVMPQAGKDGGSLILPRVGDEVAVAFAWGGADQPVVLGGLFNHANRPHNPMADRPYRTVMRSRGVGADGLAAVDDLPATTRISANDAVPANALVSADAARPLPVKGNELAFDDTAEQERTDLFSCGKLNLLAAKDGVLRVGGDLTIEAGSSLTLRVGNTMLRMEHGSLMLGVYSASDPDMSSAMSFTPLCLDASAPTVAVTGLMTASLNSSGSSVVAETVNVSISAISASITTNAIGGALEAGTAIAGLIAGAAAKGSNTSNPALISSAYEVDDSAEVVALVQESLLAASDLAFTVAYLIKEEGLLGSASLWCIGGTAEIYSTLDHALEFTAITSGVATAMGSTLAAYPQDGWQCASIIMENLSIVMNGVASARAMEPGVYPACWELHGTGRISYTCVDSVEEYAQKNETGLNHSFDVVDQAIVALDHDLTVVTGKVDAAERTITSAMESIETTDYQIAAISDALETTSHIIDTISEEVNTVNKDETAALATIVNAITNFE